MYVCVCVCVWGGGGGGVLTAEPCVYRQQWSGDHPAPGLGDHMTIGVGAPPLDNPQDPPQSPRPGPCSTSWSDTCKNKVKPLITT